MTTVAMWKAHETERLPHAWRLPEQPADSATPLSEPLSLVGSLPNGEITGTRSIKRIGTYNVEMLEPDRHPEQGGSVLTWPSSVNHRSELSRRRFPASLGALRSLRSDHSPAGWSEAAATLKRDAVRLRRTHYGRHASILLAIADALTFTEPDDPTLDTEASTVLERGLSLLAEPHITDSAEENFLTDLLSRGWNLTPSVGEERPEV